MRILSETTCNDFVLWYSKMHVFICSLIFPIHFVIFYRKKNAMLSYSLVDTDTIKTFNNIDLCKRKYLPTK